MIDFANIPKPKAHLPTVVAEFQPVIQAGNKWLTRCPIHNDTHPSMILTSTHYSCPVCRAVGDPRSRGDWADYLKLKLGWSYGVCLRNLKPEWLRDVAQAPVQYEIPTPKTEFAALANASNIWKVPGFTLKTIHYYYSAPEIVHFCIIRYERNGTKTFRTLINTDDGLALKAPRLRPLPLYNLPDLLARPDAPVMFVEGEKCADFCTRHFPDYVVVTTPFGAGSLDMTDLTPLQGRTGVILPDNDPAGLSYAAKVAEKTGLSVHQWPPHMPVKADVADLTPETFHHYNICYHLHTSQQRASHPLN